MQVISISNQYASGLRRLGAWFIDSLVVGFFVSIIFHVSHHSIGYSFFSDGVNMDFFRSGFFTYKIAKFTLAMLYFAYMESSKYQATLGKIVLGIKVVDKNDHRLEFPQALLRNLSKILSAFVLGIGYIMIIFDAKKQGLHDKIAETFVVKQ